MTNTQIGALIGVSESMASRMQSGQRMPGRDTIMMMVDVFGTDANAVFAAIEKGPDSFAVFFVNLIAKYEKAASQTGEASRVPTDA